VSSRSRKLGFGSAALLVLAGGVCAVLVAGVVGEVLTFMLISLGLCGALLLMFLEIGLGEEHDLDRERHSRADRDQRMLELRRHSRLPRRPRRPQ
jgi:hypothetical protein